MADIRSFIKLNLLGPLKDYPTKIQDTMIEIITQRLQRLYNYTVKFPEVISPNKNRLDILRAIADQFLFSVRDDADIQEQINILDNILYVYSKRGSVDTIENMWKYYGGTLPKDIKVVIPSYNLFRYSVSKLSGNHVFQDNETNRTGVYEIKLTNNNYPIPELKDFLLKELVAAGNYIYFTNTLHSDIVSTNTLSNHYKYQVQEETLSSIQLEVLKSRQGFTWSGYNTLSKRSEDSAWSGRGAIFLEVVTMLDLSIVAMNTCQPYLREGVNIAILSSLGGVEYRETEEGDGKTLLSSITSSRYKNWDIRIQNLVQIDSFLYCTSTDSSISISRYLYDRQGNLINSRYPGYFVLGETLLGEEVI